ncbi:MAG: hydantoinase B/oxoprolinase family protein [Acidimicrobiales bacterium]
MTLIEDRPDSPIRDMGGDEFLERYDCDQFTATVLSNRFRYVVDNMVTQLQRVAFSPIVQIGDLAATLCGPPELGYAMPAVSATLPYFVGSLPDGVRLCFEEFGLDDLRPGDVIVVNDPYRQGTHLNDVSFMRPLFHDGQMLGALVLRCHMLDLGGVTAGGFDTTKPSTYHDGLVFPPMLIFRDEEPNKPLLRMIFDNTRFPAVIVPDIMAIHAALRTAEQRIRDSITRYGVESYLGAIRYTCDASAEAMSDAISRIADGDYSAQEILDTDSLPESDPYRVNLTIRKRGQRAEFDFSGSSTPSRSALNSAWPDTKTAVTLALTCLIAPEARFTSASLRDVDLVVPPNSIINPQPPHSTNYYFELQQTMMMAVYGALNPVLGADAVPHDGAMNGHTVDGVLDGEEWFSGRATSSHSPWGGSSLGDGDTQQANIFLNMPVTGIEEDETTSPFLSLALDVVPDSGGPGRHRGGAARFTDSYWLRTGTHRSTHFHTREPISGGGVNGGGAGLMGGCWIWDTEDARVDPSDGLPFDIRGGHYAQAQALYGLVDPASNELSSEGSYVWSGAVEGGVGAVVRSVSNGAGGWGDPLDRDIELVLQDVRDEYVTIEGARRDYGVVVVGDPASDPEGLVVDAVATAEVRGTSR